MPGKEEFFDVDKEMAWYKFSDLPTERPFKSVRKKSKAVGSDHPKARPVIATKAGRGGYNSGETIEFDCITSVQEKGFDPHSVGACLRGKLKKHGGYTWAYKEKVNE